MGFRIARTEQFVRDLEVIFRHLIESYVDLGDDLAFAIARAEARMSRINHHTEAIAGMPYKGTINRDLGVNIRHITKDGAIVYFSVDDQQRVVLFLAIFFGGQDHLRHMTTRLSAPSLDA